MLTLMTFPAAFGAPSASPFGVKAICLLNMAGAKWQMGRNPDPRKSPKGKLPVLIDGTREIPDSEEIRSYLEQKFKIDFDEGLSEAQRAVSRAVIRMCDEHLYFALVCERWLNDANWEIVREVFFCDIPKLMRGPITKKIRKEVRDDMQAQGMGRHSEAEQFSRVDNDIRAILGLLGDQLFLFGDQPSAADASAGPMISALAVSPVPTALSRRINEDAPLMAYLENVRATLYP